MLFNLRCTFFSEMFADTLANNDFFLQTQKSMAGNQGYAPTYITSSSYPASSDTSPPTQQWPIPTANSGNYCYINILLFNIL